MNQFIPATVPVVAKFKDGRTIPIIAWEVQDLDESFGEGTDPVPGLVGHYVEFGSTYLMAVSASEGFVSYEYGEGD